MIRPNLFLFPFRSFLLSPLIRAGNLCQHIRSRAAPCHEQTRHTDQHTPTDSSRGDGCTRLYLSSLTLMSNHKTNCIRAPNLNRFREADGRTIVPGWNASRREPCAHGAIRIPSPLLGCA